MGALYIISIHPPNNSFIGKKTETYTRVDRARNRQNQVLIAAISASTVTPAALTFC